MPIQPPGERFGMYSSSPQELVDDTDAEGPDEVEAVADGAREEAHEEDEEEEHTESREDALEREDGFHIMQY